MTIADRLAMTPKRFTIWLDSAVLAEFERRAKQQRRSVSWVIREVLTAAASQETPNVQPNDSVAQMTEEERTAFFARIAKVEGKSEE